MMEGVHIENSPFGGLLERGVFADKKIQKR